MILLNKDKQGQNKYLFRNQYFFCTVNAQGKKEHPLRVELASQPLLV